MPGKDTHTLEGFFLGIGSCIATIVLISSLNSSGMNTQFMILLLPIISLACPILGSRMPDFDWSPSWRTKNPFSGNKKLIVFYGMFLSIMIFSPLYSIDMYVYLFCIILSTIISIIIASNAVHRGWFHTITLLIILSIFTGISVANAIFGMPGAYVFVTDISNPVLSWFIYVGVVSISTALGYYTHLYADKHVHIVPPKKSRK